MAEDDRAFEDEVPNAPSLPIVHITTAYAGLSNVYADVVGVPKLRYRAVLKGYIFHGAQDEGRVLCMCEKLL